MSAPDINAVREYLLSLQDTICKEIEDSDGKQKFAEDDWQRPAGGGGRTRVLNNGAVFEQAGVNFSEVSGLNLPGAVFRRWAYRW